ncbi:unnamed protein product, partial [marine sediment metagenome]
SPATYGDYWWKQQVDAQKLFNDDSEEAVSSYVNGLLGEIPLIDEFPAGIRTFIEGLREPPSFAFLPFMAGVGINAVDEALDIAFEPVMTALKRNYGKRYKSKWLTSEQVNVLWSRQKITEGLWDEVIATEGYESVLGNSLYESQLPYPSIPELITYARYHGNADAPWSEFQKWFKVSPRDWPVWKWLGQQRLNSMQLQTLYRRGLISQSELVNRLAQIGWNQQDRESMEQLSWTTPNAMLLVQGDLMQGIGIDQIIKDISLADINPVFAQKYYDGILTKPSSSDLVAYELR